MQSSDSNIYMQDFKVALLIFKADGSFLHTMRVDLLCCEYTRWMTGQFYLLEIRPRIWTCLYNYFHTYPQLEMDFPSGWLTRSELFLTRLRAMKKSRVALD